MKRAPFKIVCDAEPSDHLCVTPATKGCVVISAHMPRANALLHHTDIRVSRKDMRRLIAELKRNLRRPAR